MFQDFTVCKWWKTGHCVELGYTCKCSLSNEHWPPANTASRKECMKAVRVRAHYLLVSSFVTFIWKTVTLVEKRKKIHCHDLRGTTWPLHSLGSSMHHGDQPGQETRLYQTLLFVWKLFNLGSVVICRDGSEQFSILLLWFWKYPPVSAVYTPT